MGKSSSSPITSDTKLDVSICVTKNGHAVGTAVAVMVPKVDVIVCGGLRRSEPVGGSAKGMPLNESTPDEDEPTTVPFWIVTEGAAARSSMRTGAACTVTASRKGRRMEYMAAQCWG